MNAAGRVTCRRCGQTRARRGDDLCPVCWLVQELAREHRAGEHARVNPSCVACTQPDPPARTSHEMCSHAATASERAKCRRRRRAEIALLD